MRVVLALALAAGAGALAPSGPSPRSAGARLRSSVELAEPEPPAADARFDDDDDDDAAPRRVVPVPGVKSRALPWMARPQGLDDVLVEGDYSLVAGDFGFDPLDFAGRAPPFGFGDADQIRRVRAFRNAEIKHGRLAMLAVVGWPLSELFDGRIAQRFGLSSELVNPDAAGIGLAPSTLNGGLAAVSPAYWAVVLAAAAGVELLGLAIEAEAERAGVVTAPGDFGFDPLGLYPQAGPFGPGLSLEERRCVMREQELTHGRTAMLAIFGFVAQEKLTGVPVVEETPQFFLPDAQGVQAELQFSEIARVSFDVVKSLWPF